MEAEEIKIPDIEDLFGSAHDDILVGARSSNRLIGFDGNDELDGREGHDLLEGRNGADVLRGGEGNDIVSCAFSREAVEVRLYDGTAQGGEAEGDTFPGRKTVEYVNPAGDTIEIEVPDVEDLIGSARDDILDGAHGSNRLGGYIGNDELDGREGDDWLAVPARTGYGAAKVVILPPTCFREKAWKYACITVRPGSAKPKVIHLRARM